MPCFLITLSLCLFPCLLQSVRNFVSVFIAVTPLKPMSSLFRRFGYFLCFPFSLILVVLLCLSLSVRACFCLYVRPVVPGTAHVKTVRVNVRACEQKRFFLTASDRLWSSSLSLSFSVSLYVCVCICAFHPLPPLPHHFGRPTRLLRSQRLWREGVNGMMTSSMTSRMTSR